MCADLVWCVDRGEIDAEALFCVNHKFIPHARLSRLAIFHAFTPSLISAQSHAFKPAGVLGTPPSDIFFTSSCFATAFNAAISLSYSPPLWQ